ncbi:MAG: hypothetical protein A3G09_03265 [Candidatus Moranbacteria bacterium RIFCSPLOWO2_12_FULL_48_12]|nr:MAG: hypothetical protein A3G09_03265 [Candidatus Moranbacteria bacterium RIFCSPLOWO2_12_FULL_48_12]
MERNGVRACLVDESYFAPGYYASMHFSEKQWQDYDVCYPEVGASQTHAPVENFCMPPQAEYELERLSSGEIAIRIFAREMPKTPVMEWIFPSPDDVRHEGIYGGFMRGV